MTKITYVEKKFMASTMALIDTANRIIEDYIAEGLDLTIRQLYYQLVVRDYIPNEQRQYKKLVKTISDARLAGLVSWTAIVDRTRYIAKNSHWDDPRDIIRSAEYSFQIDKWKHQLYRPEVWIEKDALRGAIAGICSELDIPHFACRGYTSQSEIWAAAMRLRSYIRSGQRPYIIHLGDHDPSGLDMTRDIIDRLETFGIGFNETHFLVQRIALNFDQVEQYVPPPNPAKFTDSRIESYVSEYGLSSWELDALEPTLIRDLIRDEVLTIRDNGLWDIAVDRENELLGQLQAIRANYDEIQEFLSDET